MKLQGEKIGIRAPTAWAELQHHGCMTLPPGTQRGLQPTTHYIFEAVTGHPRFPAGMGGDEAIRHDDRGTVNAQYVEEQRRRAALRRGRFVQSEIRRRANAARR